MKFQTSFKSVIVMSILSSNSYSNNTLFEKSILPNNLEVKKEYLHKTYSKKKLTKKYNDLTIKEIIEIPTEDTKDAVSFNELFKKSLKYNYDIQQMENRKDIIKEDIHMEKLGYYPQVDFEYNNYKSYKDYERDSSPYKTRKATLSVNTTLRVYDFDAKKAKIDSLRQENVIGELTICENKIKTSFELLDAYTSIQSSRESILVLKKLILEHQKKFDMKTKLYEQGLLSATELISDKAALLSAVNELNTEDNRIEYYSAIVKIRTGYNLTQKIKLVPLTHHFNILDKNYELYNIKTKITNEKINKHKNEIKFYKNSAKPTIDLYFNNDFYNEDSEGYSKYSNKRDYRVGINLKWSFNSIFNYKSQKRRKLLEIKNEEILYDKSKQEDTVQLNRRFIEIKNYEVFKKVSDEKINTLQNEIEKNTRMYNEGLEYKYKISDSKIKIFTEQVAAVKRKYDNVGFKKYISIMLEKDNICTLL